MNPKREARAALSCSYDNAVKHRKWFQDLTKATCQIDQSNQITRINTELFSQVWTSTDLNIHSSLTYPDKHGEFEQSRHWIHSAKQRRELSTHNIKHTHKLKKIHQYKSRIFLNLNKTSEWGDQKCFQGDVLVILSALITALLQIQRFLIKAHRNEEGPNQEETGSTAFHFCSSTKLRKSSLVRAPWYFRKTPSLQLKQLKTICFVTL